MAVRILAILVMRRVLLVQQQSTTVSLVLTLTPIYSPEHVHVLITQLSQEVLVCVKTATCQILQVLHSNASFVILTVSPVLQLLPTVQLVKLQTPT